MEDYREKIEKLPLERLVMLAEVYRNTIRQIEDYRRDAEIVAFNNVVKYTDGELAKKKTELAEIESIIARLKKEQ